MDTTTVPDPKKETSLYSTLPPHDTSLFSWLCTLVEHHHVTPQAERIGVGVCQCMDIW